MSLICDSEAFVISNFKNDFKPFFHRRSLRLTTSLWNRKCLFSRWEFKFLVYWHEINQCKKNFRGFYSKLALSQGFLNFRYHKSRYKWSNPGQLHKKVFSLISRWNFPASNLKNFLYLPQTKRSPHILGWLLIKVYNSKSLIPQDDCW